MKNLLELIKSLYGSKAISSTIGTRTNVVRLPSGKLQRYLSTELNMEAASDAAAQNAYNEMKQLIPDVAKMNDAERLIFEGNLRRLKNKLETSGILPKQTVPKEGEVVSIETKEPVTGENLKKLTEEKGTINPPTTIAGQLEQSAKRLEGLGKNLEKEFAKSKKRSASEILDEYFHSYRTMQSIEDEGLVRAVARQIMYQDLNAGRLKVPKEVEDTIRGMTAKDVLDDFSQWYGAAALEDLFDNAQKFYRMESPQEAIKFLKENKYSNWENVYQPREKPIKEYMEPEEFKKMMENATINRVGIVVPKGSEKLDNATAKEIYDFYLKTGDRKLIQEEMKSISEGTKFDSFATEDKNKILDILTDVLKKLGLPTAAGGVGLEYLAEKTTPQIEGGTQQSLGLDYLTGMGPSEGYANGGRIGFQKGTIPKMLEFLIEKLSVEKGFNKGLLERSKPKAVQDLYIEKFGSLPTAEEIANMVNKELKGKSSMEVVNPKTGEVTTPTEPVKTARTTADIEKEIDELSTNPITTLEEKRKYNDLHSEFINSLDPGKRNKNLDYRRKSLDLENRLLLKAEEKGLDFDTFEKLRQGLYDSRKQKTLDFIKTGKVNLEPLKPITTFEEVQDRFKIAAKAADEIFPNYNTPKTAAQELAEVMAEQKYKKTYDNLTGDQQNDLYSEAYNYITSVNRLPKRSPANVPEQVLEKKMNEVLNQYDKSMFIKDEQGMVDVSNPQNVEKMALLLKRDHPDLYNQLFKLTEDINQKQILNEFDVTGRKPNASGGLNYLMGL